MTRRNGGAQEAGYQIEHWSAWLMALVAIVMIIIGLLVGFNVIGAEDGGIQFREEQLTPGGEQAQAQSQEGILNAPFQDGLLFLLPALIAGILAFALHFSDHHRLGMRTMPKGEMAIWGIEHFGAYVMVLGAIGLGILGILVGFDVFNNNNTQADGMIWHLGGLTLAALGTALHAVRHHQVVSEEDYIVAVVEERVGTREIRRPVPGETAPERHQHM